MLGRLYRWIAYFICAASLLLAAGCAAKEAEIAEDTEDDAGYRRTVLYYQTDGGYVVPVMKMIPWEEGIGKAALAQLVDTEENARSLGPMGLRALIPDGTSYTLRIGQDGSARVDLVGLSALADAAEEQAMVTAIVNTLTEFSSIQTVEITLDGAAVKTLPHGTALRAQMGAFALNAADGEVAASTGSAHAMTLYFPNSSASLNVPVTVYSESEPTFAAAVEALIAGPEQEGLLRCFPEGTALNEARIEDGVAHVDVSGVFRSVEEVEGMLEAAYDSLYFTANALEEVAGVDLYVEGEPCCLSKETSAPLYVNEFR